MSKLHARKAGFALPLVLTVVAILTLTYAVALNSLINLRAETKHAMQRGDFERAAMTAEARLSFLMTTEPFGAAMLNIGAARNTANAGGQVTNAVIEPTATITMDNRPYRFLETANSTTPYFAEIQDEAGLFNIYPATVEQLTRLFLQLGELDDQDAESLAGEVIAYNANRTLHMPMRRPSALLDRIPIMRDLISPRAWRTLSEKITAYPDETRFNVNTAGPDVISIMFNVDDATAAAIVDGREGTVISTLTTVGLVSPTPGRQYTFPSGRLRLTLIDPVSGLTYRSSLLFTPGNANRPIWVENPHTLVTVPPEDVSIDDLEPFPDVPNLAS